MIENNPLKQYFRRPSMYFRLPSNGKYYAPGVVNIPENFELPVYPMTAIDEMTVRTPDGLYNGTAVVDLIKSCVPNIVDPWKLNNIDLNAVLIAIKAAAGDGKIEIISTCPGCTEETKYDIELFPILAGIGTIDYEKPLVIRELEVKFKPLTYAETNANSLRQFQVQKTLVDIESMPDGPERTASMNSTIKNLNRMIIEMVSDTIEYIKTPETTVTNKQYIIDFMENCDRTTGNTIRDYSIKLREQNELKPLDVKCPTCENKYKQQIVLNVTDFFE
jgi:hypothetical protein